MGIWLSDTIQCSPLQGDRTPHGIHNHRTLCRIIDRFPCIHRRPLACCSLGILAGLCLVSFEVLQCNTLFVATPQFSFSPCPFTAPCPDAYDSPRFQPCLSSGLCQDLGFTSRVIGGRSSLDAHNPFLSQSYDVDESKKIDSFSGPLVPMLSDLVRHSLFLQYSFSPLSW